MIVSIDERSDNTSITTYAEHYKIRRILVNKVYFFTASFAVYIPQAKAWGFDGGVLIPYDIVKQDFVEEKLHNSR